MELPEVGAIVTTIEALGLCRHFGLIYLVDRIQENPDAYKDWEFDGCSGLPDQLMGLFTGCDWKTVTYQCCLPHDLSYAYGEIGNVDERRQVDVEFYDNLVNKAGMHKMFAAAFLAAVRIGGHETLGLPFSWGFAKKTKKESERSL